MRVAAAVVALVVCVHTALWAVVREQASAPDVQGPLASISFAPYQGSTHPDKGNVPTPAQIRADL
jgi:hypothetical protein